MTRPLPWNPIMLGLLSWGCQAPARPDTGQWIGDLRRPAGTERMEVEIDSAGAARLTIAGWAADRAPASRIELPDDRLGFLAVIGKDTVRVVGRRNEGQWIGLATRGEEKVPFGLHLLHPVSDAEWRGAVGTYRTEQGNLLGIAPFSEFGTRPFLVDYSSGRIGPLLPIGRHRFLIGRALMTPLFPADTLELRYRGGQHAIGARVVSGGTPPVIAERVATMDAEVEFRNGTVTLGGTLTLPPGPPPYPALVLVHGSNALTRDVFGPWTRFFAGLGYAVLAYDKRGTGTSTGNWKEADFSTLAADVLAGVRFLAGRPDIRADRIGLWGASQAGWIMPMVAAEAPRDIAFLAVHAGSGTTVREQGVLYLQHELRFAGLPETSVAVGTRYQQLDDSVTRAGAGWERLNAFYESHRATETWLWPPRAANDEFRPYYRMLMDFDPAPSWRRVRCPVLLFFGELDANVPPKESWPPIERALREGGNGKVTQVVLRGANHLFLAAKTGSRDEYPGLSRFIPDYFSRMAQWLQRTGR